MERFQLTRRRRHDFLLHVVLVQGVFAHELVSVLQQQLDQLDALEADEVEELGLKVIGGPLRLEVRSENISPVRATIRGFIQVTLNGIPISTCRS